MLREKGRVALGQMRIRLEKFKIMNAFQLKILMAILMLLDHLRYIDNFVSPGTASFFTTISRCVAPMFAYLAVEGIRHTHNLKRYCMRLSILAGIIFIGNATLNTCFKTFSEVVSGKEQLISYRNDNVIFTLALGVFAILLIREGKCKRGMGGRGLYVISMISFLLGIFWGEWGTVILPFMFIEYFFHDKMRIRLLGYVLIEVIAIILPFGEPLYFLVFPFMLLYNGQRGPQTKFSKYFFYAFYPIHLWIIEIINFVLRI